MAYNGIVSVFAHLLLLLLLLCTASDQPNKQVTTCAVIDVADLHPAGRLLGSQASRQLCVEFD